MGGLNGAGDLGNDLADLAGRERSAPFGVFLEDLSFRPLDGEKMQSARITDLDRPDDIRVRDPRSVFRFAEKTGDSRRIVAELLAKHLQCDRSMGRMLGTKNGRRSALADERVNGVTSHLLSDQGIASHAANLILTSGRGKQDPEAANTTWRAPVRR